MDLTAFTYDLRDGVAHIDLTQPSGNPINFALPPNSTNSRQAR